MLQQVRLWGPMILAVMAGALSLCLASPVSAEFRVPPSTGFQSQPVVGADARGTFVVAWKEFFPQAAQPLNTIRFQRWNADGLPLGTSERVDVLPGDNARNPALDVAADGTFVVVWEGGASDGPYRRTVWAQRYGPDGRPQGQVIRVTEDRLLAELNGVDEARFGTPAVSIAPNGSFVVVWRDDGGGSCSFGNILARRYSRNGAAIGEAFRVNPSLKLTHFHPAIDHDSRGNFVIVWQRGSLVGTVDERSLIQGQRFSADGKLAGGVFAVRGGRGRASAPALHVAPDGSFSIAWIDRRLDAESSRVMARSFTASGERGPVLDLGTADLDDLTGPSLVPSPGDGIAVVWPGPDDDLWTGNGIWLQRISKSQRPVGNPERIGPITSDFLHQPAAVSLPDGGVVVVWRSYFDQHVSGQRIDAANQPLLTRSLAATVDSRWRGLAITMRRDHEAWRRRMTAEEIGRFRFEASEAAQVLRTAATSDPAAEVRGAALVALARVSKEPRSVFPLCVAAASEPSPTPRHAAARCLGILAQPDGVPVLMGLLNSKTLTTTRPNAISALVDIGGIENLEAILRKSIADKDSLVRTAAAAGLVRLEDPPDDTAELVLEAFDDDPEPHFALTLVGRLGPSAAPVTEHVSEFLSSENHYLRTSAINCLTAMEQPIFAQALRDPSPLVRAAAADGLRKLGPDALRPAEATLAKAGERESHPWVKGKMDGAWFTLQEAACLEH